MHGEATLEMKFTRRTQLNMLRNWLISGKKVDATIAREKMGIGHLPRRILDLKEEGLIINSRFVEYTRRFDGQKTHIKEYWQVQEDPQDSKTPDHEYDQS